MIDRRGFMIGTAAAASTPALPALAAPAALEAEPDAWEADLREIELFIRVLRESRAKISEIETNPALSDAARANLLYLYSITAEHSARMVELTGKHSRWKAEALLKQHWENRRNPPAACLS